MDGELVKSDDGRDRLFGDNGNDWIVGGTNCDWLFGGFGDDYLQLDDNLETNGGANDNPEDDDPRFRDGDFAFGGAGRDVLIANTALDRMYDWGGEFNTFVVPFAPFGSPDREPRVLARTSATLDPGAEPGAAARTRSSAPFTPYDELALVDAAGSRPLAGPTTAARATRSRATSAASSATTSGGEQPLVPVRLHAGHPHHEAACGRSTAPSHGPDRRGRHARHRASRPARRSAGRYEVTNVSQNPTLTIDAGLDDHVAHRRQRHAGRPDRRLPPGLRQRRHQRQRHARHRRDWLFTSQGVAGATRTAPDGIHANTVTVQARCVTTGVPGLRQRHHGRRHRRQPRHRQRRHRRIRIKKAINAANPLAPTPAEEADCADRPGAGRRSPRSPGRIA